MDDIASQSPSAASPQATPDDAFLAPQLRFGAALYLGWAALIWLSQFAGLLTLDTRSAKILLLGTCATNIMFFIIQRNDADDPLPADTMSLLQCIVGIVWATVFAFLSSGAGFVAIGIYVSIILFAMFRVSKPVLNQIIVFSVIAYSMVNFSKLLIVSNQSLASDYLFQMLIFAGIMTCLTSASRYIYQQQQRLEDSFHRLRQNLQKEQAESFSRLLSRRYILDILAREKARTDRKNMPFSIGIFKADSLELTVASANHPLVAFQDLENIIRSTLRDMDVVNATEFHSGFDAGQDQKFLAVLPETNLSGARCSAERILAAVTAQLDKRDQQIRLSCGLAQYQRGESINDLLERAEQALEQATLSPVSSICDLTNEAGPSESDRATVVHFNSKRR